MTTFLLASLSTLLLPAFLSDASLTFSNSIASIAVWAALLALLRHADRLPIPKRMTRFTHVLGLLFSTMTAYGYALDRLGAIPYLDIAFAASIFLFAHVYARALSLLWLLLEQWTHTFMVGSCQPSTTPPPLQKIGVFSRS